MGPHTRRHVQKLSSAPSIRCRRAAARAQSDGSLRLRRRRHQPRDLSASIWGHRDGGTWRIRKVIEIPPSRLTPRSPPLLKGFGAVPPLVTDINLRWTIVLYVSCWGTGELNS
jgi:hypothetical protein